MFVIGHDPRLQKSDTLAEYCFFADYYFREVPTQRSEKAKYELAGALYSYVNFITNNKYSSEEVFVTNLCNIELDHALKVIRF